MAGDDFDRKLREGGQRRHFNADATLYERRPNLDAERRNGSGTTSERVTWLDRKSPVRDLMSPRLVMPHGLRSVGNLYGASVQIATIGAGNQFAQEAVDGGKHGATGGPSVHMLDALQIARIAQRRLAGLDVLRHRGRSKDRQGRHDPITPRDLVDAVCVAGVGITEIAMRAGWWIERGNAVIIPKQQSQKLKAALVNALGEIDAAWGERGIDARGIVGIVEVRLR